MKHDSVVVVAGLGEVGKPLLNILSSKYDCIGVDLDPVEVRRPCSVLHICYPFQIPDFIKTTAGYIEKYQPAITVINSTVAIGTTRAVQSRVNRPVVFSPVRGKHIKMTQELLHYKKFVGGFDQNSTQAALDHFSHAGMQVDQFKTPELGELSKLIETTWLGILIGWAQEVDRLAESVGGAYADVNRFIEEIAFLPSHIFPGHIGGHCVMPNIEILRDRFTSNFLEAVVHSNTALDCTLVTSK